MKTNVRRAVHKIALIAFMHAVCGNAQPVPQTNHAEITITGEGAALTIKCTFLESVSSTNLEERPGLFVFLMRTNGPPLNKQLLETDFDLGGLKGIYAGDLQNSNASWGIAAPGGMMILTENSLQNSNAHWGIRTFNEIREKRSLERVGYRFVTSTGEPPIREGTIWEIPVGRLMFPPTGILTSRDLNWFGSDVVVSAVLATWKKDSKTGGFSSELFSAVVSKKVNIQR
jgi:hypothetical protein